jgi:CDP-diacylglycerol--glycerol-3-phosphate 3-phosphatidyltransferase
MIILNRKLDPIAVPVAVKKQRELFCFIYALLFCNMIIFLLKTGFRYLNQFLKYELINAIKSSRCSIKCNCINRKHNISTAEEAMKIPSAMNLPNLLSISRVFLVPVVMVFLTLRTQFGFIEGVNIGDLLAGVIFIIASLTDAADGYIARKRGIVTNLGKFIDPLADKIMVVAVLVALVDLHRVPAWMVVVIIAREFIVTGLRMIAASEGVVIAASKGGKLKTVSQIIGIILLIFNLPGGLTVMWIAMALTIWSGGDYLVKCIDLLD